MSEPNIEDAIQEAILKTLSTPKEIQSEAGMIKNHTISELIELEKHLLQKKAAKAGMRFVKVEPK